MFSAVSDESPIELVLRLLISFVIQAAAAVKPAHRLPLTHAQQHLMPSEGACVIALLPL